METLWQKESKKKYLDPKNLASWAEAKRSCGKTIATLNGSFDIMHAGHLQIVYEASLQADLLLVCLNTDRSIRSYKGSSRPIISLPFRMQMLAAIGFVDYVTWFDEDTPIALIEMVKPDVHVNGSEYGKDCIESAAVKKSGGKIHIVSALEGMSTSKILEKIKTCER